MKDYVYLDTSPIEEECVQVNNKSDYLPLMKKECEDYIGLLKRKFGEPPHEAYYRIKREEHDFGSYYAVVIYFNDMNEDEVSYAYYVENNQPLTWEDDKFMSYKEVM